MSGYGEFDCVMVTPGIEVDKVALTLVADAHPVLSSCTVSVLHSLGSMMALPLPPPTTTALSFVLSTTSLAVPARQASKVVVFPLVTFIVELSDGLQSRLIFAVTTAE